MFFGLVIKGVVFHPLFLYLYFMKLFVYCYIKVYTDYDCSDKDINQISPTTGYNYTCKRFKYEEGKIHLN